MSDVTTTDAPQHDPHEAHDHDEEHGRLSPLARFAQNSTLRTLSILVAILVVFSILAPGDFTRGSNFRNIATDAAILLILSVGMTFVIVTAGIDLSVGSVLVFSGVIGG